jgi:hypothetical protein
VVIRPPVDDLYAELGVGRGATRDEIAAAFRARARELHPDAHPADAIDAEERFKRVSLAYGVLGDPAQRARYDSGRLDLRSAPRPPSTPVPPPAESPRAPPPGPSPTRPQLTRRGARWAVGSGVVLVVLGLLAAVWVVSLQRRDADLRARGVAAVATVVLVDGEHRLEFTTREGRTIRAVERTKSGEEQPAAGTRVPIHYDRTDPTTVVTDKSHTGRDVTLWIVAAKLVIGGAVLAFFGIRRLRRREVPTTR